MNGENNFGNTLLRIVEKRRETVEHRKRVLPLAALKFAVEKKAPPVRDFSAAITANRLNVIAELKKQSPSRGVIRDEFVPAKLTAELADAGAAALSVLTEEDFFGGSLAYLKEARAAAADVPVLRKDFIFDPWQVWESRAAGSDSFLLIVAILERGLLLELIELGRQLGMEPLVEIHTREELAQARDAGARIIGVNARDLATFDVSLERAFELVDEIPDECVAVAESGIHAHEDLTRLSQAGFDAFLIGEQLMKSEHPGDELRRLLAMSESKTARL
jgi:indole-3-glycerol phosphate synthase